MIVVILAGYLCVVGAPLDEEACEYHRVVTPVPHDMTLAAMMLSCRAEIDLLTSRPDEQGRRWRMLVCAPLLQQEI